MKKTKKSKSQLRREAVMKKRKERYFGIVKLPAKLKVAWLSKQDKNGWSLGLALEKRTVWLKGLRFATKKEISCVVDSTKIVYLQLKDNKDE